MKHTSDSSSFFTPRICILEGHQRSKWFSNHIHSMTKKVFVALSIAASLLAIGAAPALGQTTGALTCTPVTSTIGAGQSIAFLVGGGNGIFSFNGTGISPLTTTSTVFTASFPTSGAQSFTVTSNGQSVGCNVTVTAAGTTPLTCVNPVGTVIAGTPATFGVAGGNGTFSWSSPGLSIANPTGTSFTANFSTAGIHTVSVVSGTETSTCAVNVLPAASTGTPGDTTPGATLCSPVTQTATVGQTVTFTATGGNGAYVWSATDLSLVNPTGAGFRATYGASGTHIVTVTSNGRSSSCTINVLPLSAPGFPNTGFAPAN
jgi:hypothetical protein